MARAIGWALIGALAAAQIACAMELLELSSIVRQTASIDRETAAIRNEAALKALESERVRATYYRVLATSPFKLTEEEARGIIRSGVKKEK